MKNLGFRIAHHIGAGARGATAGEKSRRFDPPAKSLRIQAMMISEAALRPAFPGLYDWPRLVRPRRATVQRRMSDTLVTPSARDDLGLPALLDRVARLQDRTAFATLFNHFAPRLKGYLMRLGSDDGTAEEVVQEVMLTVWRRAASFDPALASIGTWVFTIARNRRIDRLRRERRPEALADDPSFVPDPVDGADVAFEAAETGERLRIAMATLPPEQSDLLKMAYYQDKSHREIAEETRLPLGTVKSRIRLALIRLRASIQGES
jgi:RNA polymerase sigma-70 factor (ECF subfamily)